MTALPTNISYGKVRGKFGSPILSAGDADGLPDFQALVGLEVTFTPKPDVILNLGASPDPVTFLTEKIVCTLDDGGYLVGPDGREGVMLIATDDEDLAPTGWTYKVSFGGTQATYKRLAEFDISVPAGSTRWLTSIAPIPSASGTSTLDAVQAAIIQVGVAVGQAQTAASAAAASAATFVPATVDTLGQATTFSKALIKTADGAAARAALSAVGKGEFVINVKDYGAVGDGVADDTNAINAAITAATALGASWSSNVPRPVPTPYANGKFKITGTINITCAVDFSQAVFFSYQTSGIALQVGDPATITQGTTFKLPQVLNMAKTVAGWAQVAGTTGVRVTNLSSCVVWVNNITQFETGFWGHANGSNGSCYNEFHLQRIYGCKVAVKLAPNDTGNSATSAWFNTNLFFGGVFGMSPTEGTVVSGTRQVLISGGFWPVNDNKFHNMALETPNAVEYMVECYGNNNVFDRCRWENTGTPRVFWRASSHSNTITPGINSNNLQFITEGSSYNYGTAQKLSGFTTAARPASIGIGGLAADTTLGRPIYSADGVIVRPVAFQDESGLAGPGAPEGVVTAYPGAIYTRTDASGSRTNRIKYPIGDSVAATTGWSYIGGTGSVASGYLRNTLTASTGSTSRWIGSPNGVTHPFAASTIYTIRGQIRMSAGLPMQLRVQFYTSGAVATGPNNLGEVFTPNTTTFTDTPPLTVQSPSDAAFATLTWAIVAGPANADGATLDLRRVIAEIGPSVGSYFDGGFTSGPGATYAWTGTAQASTSTAVYAFQPTSYVKTGAGNTGWQLIAPAGGVAVNPAATDAASTTALLNQMRAALINHGILS